MYDDDYNNKVWNTHVYFLWYTGQHTPKEIREPVLEKSIEVFVNYKLAIVFLVDFESSN